jgi:hypothetical protein
MDAPAALHHIIIRGVERRRIFSDDQDRDTLIERLGAIVTELSKRLGISQPTVSGSVTRGEKIAKTEQLELAE